MQQQKKWILIAELCAIALIVLAVRFGASNHVLGAAFAAFRVAAFRVAGSGLDVVAQVEDGLSAVGS
jgi:hypothetical protein